MEVIADTVKKVMQGLQRGERQPPQPQDLLKRLLTKKEWGHIKVNYFRKGTLNINVDSSSWLYSLNLRKEELLGRLKKDCGTIKEIRFRIGEI